MDKPFGSYPGTVEGLHDFLQSVIAAIKNSNSEETAHLNQRLNQILVIPESERWFGKVYRPDARRRIASAYRSTNPDLIRELDQRDLDELSEIKITRTEFADEKTAKSSGIHFFAGMKSLVPVYTAYLTDRQNRRIRLIHVVFVYVQGAFRVIDADFGRIDEDRRPLCGVPPGLQHLLLHCFTVDGRTMQEKLIHPVPAIHFPSANPTLYTGTLILFIVVACDGSVLTANYLSGPPDLFKVASDSVRRWHYQKTFINGQAAEVFTTVTIPIESGQMKSDAEP